MFRCELLLKLATQTPHTYYHLLSGDTLPLKSAREIYEFFDNTDRQFVQFCEPELPQRYYDWVYYTHMRRGSSVPAKAGCGSHSSQYDIVCRTDQKSRHNALCADTPLGCLE